MGTLVDRIRARVPREELPEFLELIRQEPLTDAERETCRQLLQDQWESLRTPLRDGIAKPPPKNWQALRGNEFEVILFTLLAIEGLRPEPPYYASRPSPSTETDPEEEAVEGEDVGERPVERGRRPGGEQIDGLFELDGRYFLVEAKWEQKPLPAEKIYAFRGKVDGKLVGTVGVLVSVPGFARNADATLVRGKEINVLLATGEDVGAALETGNSFRDMIHAKLREAARVGAAFYAYQTHLDKRRA